MEQFWIQDIAFVISPFIPLQKAGIVILFLLSIFGRVSGF